MKKWVCKYAPGGFRKKKKKWYDRLMICDRHICPHYMPHREPVISRTGKKMMLDICGNVFCCRDRWRIMNWIRRIRRWI